MSSSSVDVAEHGANGQSLDVRLYFQLMVFDIEPAAGPRAMGQQLARRLAEKNIPSVIYEDVNDHRGLGLLTWSDDPSTFVTRVRPLLGAKRYGALTPRPGWVMFGRTYGTGHEADLENWLMSRPVEKALDPKNTWAVWYPLRRAGAFGLLPAAEQGAMLKEHGAIGRAYGEAGLVEDVRLACSGLDPEDNDFVIGLLGADLNPISKVVGEMRGTRQTAEFLTKLGPFFVGRKAYQHPMPPKEEEPPAEEPAAEEPAAEEPEPTTQEQPAVPAEAPEAESDTDADAPAPVEDDS
ncbi:MAG: chlorite dismutase family protein [Proteobacteria bacterium]|nr:chlorite dismutase family protein [Pseudomonadota bacterium]